MTPAHNAIGGASKSSSTYDKRECPREQAVYEIQ